MTFKLLSKIYLRPLNCIIVPKGPKLSTRNGLRLYLENLGINGIFFLEVKSDKLDCQVSREAA